MKIDRLNGIDRVTLDLFTSEGAPDVVGLAEIALGSRTQKIRRILDARFSLSALEQAKRETPAWWHSARNRMGRGFYGEALREAKHLNAATDETLDAEVAAIRTPGQ